MFSVVVPTYNRPGLLQKLLESLEKQTFSKNNFEVIVVYTRPDTSEATLSSFSPSYSLKPLVIDDPDHIGKSASLKRNKGAESAKYEWLAFIDDDCIADPDWLTNAHKTILEKNPAAVEGLTKIPIDTRMTFTAKGLQFLSQFGGYQTCNMFYKKESFVAAGGFDNNLPFYLEDTDLAWSVLEKDQLIVPAKDAIVTHPVPSPNVYRWIENAVRTRKIPYLARKHPELFKKMRFKALSKSNLILGILLIATLTLVAIYQSVPVIIVGLTIYFSLSSAYVFYLLRDCKYSSRELAQMLFAFPLVPPISLFQLMRGNIEQRTFIL